MGADPVPSRSSIYRIRHLLTAVRSPTTTGKIERFHRTLRDELLSARTFASIAVVQRALAHSVASYNTLRPHEALGMATPIERFSLAGPQAAPLTGAGKVTTGGG
jgi:transposase InsO family protein